MKQIFLLACLLSTVMAGPVVKIEVGDAWADAAGYEECPEWVVANKTLPKPYDDICGVDVECWKAEALDNTDCGFGIRKILPGKWAWTHLFDSDGEKKYEKAFMRLFGYFSGANADGAKIPMTAPVLTITFPDYWYDEMMLFYLPSAFQANPPSPTDEQVGFVDWDIRLIYYRALGSNGEEIPEKVWEEEFAHLATALKRTGHSFFSADYVGGAFSEPGSKPQRFEAMFVAPSNLDFH